MSVLLFRPSQLKRRGFISIHATYHHRPQSTLSVSNLYRVILAPWQSETLFFFYHTPIFFIKKYLKHLQHQIRYIIRYTIYEIYLIIHFYSILYILFLIIHFYAILYILFFTFPILQSPDLCELFRRRDRARSLKVSVGLYTIRMWFNSIEMRPVNTS